MKRYKNIVEIPVEKIKYNREIKRIDYIEKLADKIKMEGLKHPFYVIKDIDGYVLKEKIYRFRAAKYLGYKTVPCVIETEHQRELRCNKFDITYTKIGDYYYPDLGLPEQDKEFILDHYGRERLEYLKEYKPVEYQTMVSNCTLVDHLKEVQDRAEKMRIANIKAFAAIANVTEELKQKNQLEWVGKMNNISNTVDELIRCEVIYE